MTTATSSPQRAAAEPVPFLDLAAAHAPLRDELVAAAARVVDGGWFVQGPECAAFEAAWAARTGSAACVGVASGLDALTLALRAAGVGPGDEVLVPAMTFVATWLSVLHAGATPVGVDVDPRTAAMDPGAARAAVTARTRAIVPVHLHGHPADLVALRALADEHGLVLVDDAAQAHGAAPVGAPHADATAWSFYPGKNLGALGDGGAVTTRDTALADRVRKLANYGSAAKYVHEEVGVNSRLDELQAAFLRVKLEHLDGWVARRREVARAYLDGLRDVPALVLPAAHAGHAFHLFVVRHADRDGLAARLAAHGIGTLVHYPTPPHRQACFAGTPLATGHFPAADAWAAGALSLPMGPHLADTQVARVVAAVRACA